MARALVLPAHIRRAIVAHARRAHPHECCGLLVGRAGRVLFAKPTRNVDARPDARYEVDARQHLDLQRALRDTVPSLDVIGVYHSHPEGPARPSATDLAEAHYPGWTYVIVGLAGGGAHIRAFRVVDGRARSVGLASPGVRAR
jgi:proteasome lid subunit RPN8/RPN11